MVKLAAIEKQILQQVLMQAVPIAQQTINNYLTDLEQHIGKIPATGASDLGWAPLDEDTEPGHRFWYETGAVAKHIVSKVEIVGNSIVARAGLPAGADGYQEALWNEFGWSPHGTSKVVRRALFIPLAEHHLRELNALLKERFSTMKINLRIKI